MGSNTETETVKSARHSIYGTSQPTVSQDKKTAQQTGNDHRNIMATITDDDDRLLVRIGYTPVWFLPTLVDIHSS